MTMRVPGPAALPIRNEAACQAGCCHPWVPQGLGLPTAHGGSARIPTTDVGWRCLARGISGENSPSSAGYAPPGSPTGVPVSVPREGKWLQKS